MIIGMGLVLLALLLITIEVRASKKRKLLYKAKDIVNKDIKDLFSQDIMSNSTEAAAIGAGATGISILSLYSAVENHEDVLKTLEYRFPSLTDFDPISFNDKNWFAKITNLSGNEKSLETYINAYKGQKAEFITKSLFEDMGHDPELFESRTHQGYDIYLKDTGEKYSVKCGSEQYIRDEINQNIGSVDKYVINTEAYTSLEENGLISAYSEQGITILDGGFSNEVLENQGEEALNAILDAGDISDNIPFLAIASLVFKTAINVKDTFQKKQTGTELGINVASDCAKIGVGAATGIGGTHLGAYVGTIIAPGIGTLIGSGIGAVAGYIAGSQFVGWIKERLKWGKIIDAIEHFGNKYDGYFSESLKNNIGKRYLNTEEIEQKINNEGQLLKKYQAQINPYKKEEPTVPAILCKEYHDEMKDLHIKIFRSLDNVHKLIYEICKNISEKMVPDDKDKQETTRKKLLGEIILCNQWILKGEELTENDLKLIKGYNEQIIKSPNHPYKFKIVPEEIIKYSTLKSFEETPLYKSVSEINYNWLIYIASSILIATAFYLSWEQIQLFINNTLKTFM